MRLLHSQNRELKKFMSDKSIPPYAILSHTWGDDEVSFEDWLALTKSPNDIVSKQGYRKIDLACQQAIRERLEWVWIDTCCIDSKSSAELSEAINSMFRWYKGAEVCYAYLSDVPFSDSQPENEKHISGSRWFTRGWTLQELLAPSNVVFYSEDWQLLGTKSGLCDLLCSVTRIDQKFLRGEVPLESAGIAKRMSWAANRDTSRTEDIAYCLLGLFDINMPLLYGEGKKAFLRLQAELMKSYPYDHSLFAWGKVVVDEPSCTLKDGEKIENLDTIEWDAQEAATSLGGLFAKTPNEFEYSGDFAPCEGHRHFNSQNSKNVTPSVTAAGGVSLELSIKDGKIFGVSAFHRQNPNVTTLRQIYLAMLICEYKDSRGPAVAIPLIQWSNKCYGRTHEIVVFHRILSIPYALRFPIVCNVEPEISPKIDCGDIVVRLWPQARKLFYAPHAGLNVLVSHEILAIDNELLKIPRGFVGMMFSYWFYSTNNPSLGFCLCLERGSVGLDAVLGDGTNTTVFMLPTLLESPQSNAGTNPFVLSEEVYGLRWHTWKERERQIWGTGDFETSHSHTFKHPEESWDVDIIPFPLIKVTVARRKIDESKTSLGFFDLIDISFRDRAEPPPGRRILPLPTKRRSARLAARRST